MKLPIFKIENYYADREFVAKYMLSSSDPQTLSMSELVAMASPESLQLWNNLHLHYSETKGHPRLKELVAERYDLKSDNVLITTSSEEGIYCTMSSLLTADDHAIVVMPCYQSLLSVAESVAQVTRLPLKEENGWQIDIEDLKQTIRPNTKLIVINFPHNPTGATLTKETFQAIINLAEANGIYIFSDEVYRDMEHNPTDQLPAMASAYSRGISLGGMSKSYGLPGLRIGWVVSQDKKLLNQIEQMKYYVSICSPAPSEILAMIALENSDKIFNTNRQLILKNLEIVNQFLNRHTESLQWVHPKAGCIGFVKLLADISIDDFAHNLMQETGVLILPSTQYDWPGNYFRLGFGRTNLPKALDLFENYLNQAAEASNLARTKLANFPASPLGSKL